jgi:hypothetical protein
MPTDLKPETVEAIRAAFEAARRASLLLRRDPGRSPTVEGGHCILIDPEDCHRGFGLGRIVLSVRPGPVTDICEGWLDDMKEARRAV